MASQSTSDPLWSTDPSILFNQDRLVEFFPSEDQTNAEKINSLTRLVAYVSLAVAIYQSQATPLLYGAIVIAVIFVLFCKLGLGSTSVARKRKGVVRSGVPTEIPVASDPTGNKESFKAVIEDSARETVAQVDDLGKFPDPNKSDCVAPTEQNPFMNFLLGDDPARGPACNTSGSQEMAANLLDNQLFLDTEDLFSRNANQRLFTTKPVTTAIPDTVKFANWLSKGDALPGQCMPFDDLRQNRHLTPEDLDTSDRISGFPL